MTRRKVEIVFDLNPDVSMTDAAVAIDMGLWALIATDDEAGQIIGELLETRWVEGGDEMVIVHD